MKRGSLHVRGRAAVAEDCPLSSTAAARSRVAFARLPAYVATPLDAERNWLLVDAEGQPWPLATQIAEGAARQAHPTYTPHIDTGDFSS